MIVCRGNCTKERSKGKGTLFTRCHRNIWIPGRKWCRTCLYGIKTKEPRCFCCGGLFSISPRNADAKRRLLLKQEVKRY